jgi:hypothetical protein
MAQETLKITITADNKQAVQNIQETVTATTQLGAAFKRVTPASNQATRALIDVSRVAQDAPYGFIGIANNLNPLLESFQRLKETTGTAGGALKEMAKGLMGPAGIGLALGVVSSLIVAFGPKIASFINGTTEASKAQDKLKESLDKAQASATENGIKLLAYISVAENANNTDARRKEALSAVVNELGKVNAAYASTIKTTNDAKNAVKLYTEALVAQAITSRYIDEIADKTIALADANKKILQTGREYYKTLEMTKNMSNGYADASIVQARSTAIAKDANIDARNAAINLKNGILDLNAQLTNTITLALNNPFYVMDKGAQTLNNTVTKVVKNFQALKSVVKAPVGDIIKLEKPLSPVAPEAPQGLLGRGPSQALIEADEINKAASELAKFNYLLNEAETTSRFIAQGVGNIFQAMAQGENLGDAVLNVFKDMTLQLAQMVIQALIFKGIMSALGMGGATGSTSDLTGGLLGGLGKLLGFTPLAEGGIVSKPTFAMVGEGGESEAVMPLSKLDRILGNAFTSGANSGGGMSGGSFVLKGNDLVLALQRSNSSLNLRRGGI